MLVYFLLWLLPFSSFADNNASLAPPLDASMAESYAKGASLYRNGDFVQAASVFREALNLDPDNVPTLFNWGLCEFQSGRYGFGIAAWRKSLAIEPSFDPSRAALVFAQNKMQLQNFDNSSWLGLFRTYLLDYVSIGQLLLLSALLLVISGRLIIAYLGAKQRAIEEELSLPRFSNIAGVLSTCLFLSLGLTALKSWDLFTPYATVVAKVPIRTGPTEASSQLIELREGTNVVLRQQKDDWIQIHSPSGVSGWVPKQSIFHTSGLLLW